MTSNRPYLIRAIYQWVMDNQMTPYLLVDASVKGVQVPGEHIKQGHIVLNVRSDVVNALDLGNERIVFEAKFSGVIHALVVPVGAVREIFAKESGEGLQFEPMPEDSDSAGGTGGTGGHLRIVE